MGGQKRHWNGLVHRDLMKCGLEQNRRELAQDRSAWQRVVKTCVDAINKGAQQNEDKKMDKRRTQPSRLTATLAGLIRTCTPLSNSFYTIIHYESY